MGGTGIIIQARTGSSRLPGKMLAPFFKGKPLLEVLLERIVRSVAPEVKVVVATTVAPSDDAIVNLAQGLGLDTFRGSEEDVLGRFISAGRIWKLDKIVRVCADNPFLDMASLDHLVKRLGESDADYVAFFTADGLPTIKTHYGFWAEGVKLSALEKVASMTSEKLYHEHVTNYIYAHPESFIIERIPIPASIENNRRIRMTIDTQADLDNLSAIYAALATSGGGMDISQVVAYLDAHPSLYGPMEREIERNGK